MFPAMRYSAKHSMRCLFKAGYDVMYGVYSENALCTHIACTYRYRCKSLPMPCMLCIMCVNPWYAGAIDVGFVCM